MAGITFSHANESVGSLYLRLAPTQIDWSFTLNTSVQDTYAGQVVQILSVNFDKLTIGGQFGKEGPRGATRGPVDSQGNRKILRRSQFNNNLEGVRDYSGSGGYYSNGLTQMTEYFTRYFKLASQGTSKNDNYDEKPMTIKYNGAQGVATGVSGAEGSVEQWRGYPVSFPSYARSNANFAPKWLVEFQVYEAPSSVKNLQLRREIDRLKEGVGYKPNSEFSDPLGKFNAEDKRHGKLQGKLLKAAQDQLDQALDEEAAEYGRLMPAYTPAALEELFTYGASAPTKIGGQSGG